MPEIMNEIQPIRQDTNNTFELLKIVFKVFFITISFSNQG